MNGLENTLQDILQMFLPMFEAVLRNLNKKKLMVLPLALVLSLFDEEFRVLWVSSIRLYDSFTGIQQHSSILTSRLVY